jgi:kumamolisin
VTLDRFVNPYIAGNVVTGGDMFFGREDVFSFVRSHLTGLHRDTPLVLYGQRRTGKTSVLYHLPRHLDARYRCVLIDLHGLGLDAGMGSLLWGMASIVSRSLRRDHQITVTVPGRAAFTADTADPRSAFEDVFLDEVWTALGDDHLVLMVDEVARLEEERAAGRLEPGVFEYLRHLMQHYPKLNFIFSIGSGLEEMEREYSFLFNSSMYHRISFLEPAAARALITEPASDHYDVAPAAVAKILQITSGHPYYTQLLCHSLFNMWMHAPKSQMTEADVMAVLAEAIELGSANLTFVWEYSTREEQAMMAGMASVLRASGRRITARRVRDVWREVGVTLPEGAADRAIRTLMAREVVAESGRGYSFCVDLQRLWIRKHRQLNWVKDDLAAMIQEWDRDAQREFLIPARAATLQQAEDDVGASPSSIFTAAQLAGLYDFPPRFDGRGQCVGIIELGGGWVHDDISAYMSGLGLVVPKITTVSVDGATNAPGANADTDVAMNIEIIAAAAPGADIAVYFAPNTDQGFINAIRAVASDTVNNPSVLCITWGAAESGWSDRTINEMNAALKEAASHGITVCCWTGGNGPTDGVTDGRAHVDFPASSPYVLACGGTTITANLNANLIETETVWNGLKYGLGATGGGFSDRFPAPDWQQALFADASASGELPRGRGVPDVAINAAPHSGCSIVVNGHTMVVGGAAGTALWAALIARLNQGLGERVGWLNPVLYRSLGPAGVLRDVTEGSTKSEDQAGLGHDARVGWDPCTGWGTPNGQRLLEALKLLRTVQPRETPV